MEWRARAECVKRNRKRSVWRVPPLPGMAAGFYVKQNYADSFRDHLKGLWRCKARAEYEAGRMLADAGVPVVPMLAWGRHGLETCLVSGGIRGAAPLYEAWDVCGADSRRPAFLAGLASFLARLADAGLVHPDLHVGNILAVPQPDAVVFYLVDVYGVRLRPSACRPVTERTFAWLAGFARQLSPAEGKALFAVLEGDPGSAAAGSASRHRVRGLRSRLEAAWARAIRRRWPGRRRRLTRASSLCERHSAAHGSWLLLRPFPLALAARALAAHEQQVAAGQLIKRDHKRLVSRVTIDADSCIVKEYRRPQRCARADADRRSWLNSYRLHLHSLPVALCRGWHRAADGRGFLVQADAGPCTLYRALETAPAANRRHWLTAAATILAWLHRDGIAHRDLKSTNFILADPRPAAVLPLRVIDADAVHFRRRVSSRLRIKNLRQVLHLLPASVTRAERLRFLAVYRRESGWDHTQLPAVTGVATAPVRPSL